jgi:hypothetical protein
MLVYALITAGLFVPAPLSMTLISTSGNYVGDIYGIPWNPYFWELRLVIENNTSRPYTDLDVFIRSDLLITKPGASSSINKCDIRADPPYGDAINVLGTQNSKTVNIPARTISGTVYRIHCEKLFAESRIDIVLPIVEVGAVPTRQWPPRWAIARARYYAVLRWRTPPPTYECFIPPCDETAESSLNNRKF